MHAHTPSGYKVCEPGTAVGTNGCTVRLPLYTDPATGKTGRVDGLAAGVAYLLTLWLYAAHLCASVLVCEVFCVLRD